MFSRILKVTKAPMRRELRKIKTLVNVIAEKPTLLGKVNIFMEILFHIFSNTEVIHTFFKIYKETIIGNFQVFIIDSGNKK